MENLLLLPANEGEGDLVSRRLVINEKNNRHSTQSSASKGGTKGFKKVVGFYFANCCFLPTKKKLKHINT